LNYLSNFECLVQNGVSLDSGRRDKVGGEFATNKNYKDPNN